MRILVVQDADWIKKGPHQQHHLMDIASLNGHKIVVIGFDQLWRSENRKGIFSVRKTKEHVSRVRDGADITYIQPSFVRFPFLDYLSFLFTSRREIKKCIDTFEPDIVVGFTSIVSNYWGMLYARKNRIPFVYYWTDVIHLLIPSKSLQPLGKIIEAHIVKHSSFTLAINEALRDYLVELGSLPSRTNVISGGVDLDVFDRSAYDRDRVRERFGISKNETVLFFMGWIYEFSGLTEVISSMKKKKLTRPDLKLMIVGDGDYWSQLKREATEMGMGDRVIFTGKRPFEEIPSLIEAADICLLPTHDNEIMRYIVPIKLYEYLAMGKPVISTNLPGVMREFGDGHGVIYASVPTEVVDKVIQLGSEDIRISGDNGRKFVENLDWGRLETAFEDLLLSLISRATS